MGVVSAEANVTWVTVVIGDVLINEPGLQPLMLFYKTAHIKREHCKQRR